MIKKVSENLDIADDRYAQREVNFNEAHAEIQCNLFRSFLFPSHFREIYYCNII